MKKFKAMRNLIFFSVCVLAACTDPLEEVRSFNGDRAYGHVKEIQEFGPRTPGSESSRLAASWIKNRLHSCGYIVQEEDFTYNGVELVNILATSNGRLDQDTILLGTHYDTRPVADKDGQHPYQPVPGANDGASGVAVLIELACSIEKAPTPIAFAFFDGEDSGNLNGWDWAVGSTHFARRLTDRPAAVVIVDMVGDQDLQIFYERNSNLELNQQIWQAASSLGFSAFVADEKYAILDDHIPFVNLGIPAVNLIDFDYAYHHTTEDTLDKISAESLRQVGRTLQIWLMKHKPLR